MNNDNLINPDRTQLTYGTYLKVPELLALQTPVSIPAEQDEMLFIVIHQVYELWFKQILHEAAFCIEEIKQDALMPALRTIKRINTIQDTLTKQVDILETMTPNDFNRFRDRLNPASGFQSAQFRVLEFLLGAKNPGYLKYHEHFPEAHKALIEAMEAPSLYDHFFKYLTRRGFSIPVEILDRDVTKAYQGNADVMETLLQIYRRSDEYYDLYMMLEALADLDEKFLLWRYRHVAMVERMIGQQQGTGGSSGVKYLASTLSKRFFPEIWQLRDHLTKGY